MTVMICNVLPQVSRASIHRTETKDDLDDDDEDVGLSVDDADDDDDLTDNDIEDDNDYDSNDDDGDYGDKKNYLFYTNKLKSEPRGWQAV